MAARNGALALIGATIVRGVRPLDIRASLLSGWLGQQVPLSNHDFWRQFLGGGTFTGKAVTVDQALKLATVWACVRLLSETLATLPLGFYRRNADGSRTAATGHPLYDILHNQPNGDMTAVAFWECVVVAMLIWGNAYIEIVRRGSDVVSLNLLLPSCMNVRRLKTGALEYRYRDETKNTERTIAESNMMHIPAFSIDGIMGLSAVQYGCNVFGTAIETDRTSAETFANSNRATGLIEVNKPLTNAQREMYRAHVKKVSEDGGVYVFEGGTKYESLKFNPADAELLASRSWNVEEICRWFGLDPAMVGHGGKDSNWGTGLEQKMLWFLIFALRKWCVRIEQAIRKSLLTVTERASLFAEFNMEGLLRGDSAARASWYSTMTQNGVMTRDECRTKENLAPMGGNAAVLTIQSNMMPIDALGMNQNGDGNNARDTILAWLGLSNAGGNDGK